MPYATPPADSGRAPAGRAPRHIKIAATAVACLGLAAAAGCAAASPPPTLGRAAGVFAHGEGFGQVKPAKIYNGGDPTGLVTHVAWASWGGARAVATGVSDYVGPGQSVAGGTEEIATVVAFHLGTCHGKLMYQAVEWYFPQHGQRFNARQYENICTGSYTPGL